MKKTVRALCLLGALLVVSNSILLAQSNIKEVVVSLDLVTINKDRVAVSIIPPKITTLETTFYMPKIIPGTYSEDNYGRYLDNFKAFDAKGNQLSVAKMDENAWQIKDAKKLAKVTYLINDTFDSESGTNFGQGDIFSPAGTNIEEGVSFVINNHAFVGYFKAFQELPYRLNIIKPVDLYGASALNNLSENPAKDVFLVNRYAELIDHPIMYSKSKYTSFIVEDMEIILSVYSPNNRFKETDFEAAMSTMIQAQKKFLGTSNNTKKYAILVYLSDYDKPDAQGFGALEHNTSTMVVMPESMLLEELKQSLIDIVSHEFFHLVTPLSIHSKEIHFFDYNNPNMSKHLWMYEGITEYFANLFQVNQKLITDTEFFERMATKIENSKRYDEQMPFTKMSANILRKPYKDAYLNVYEKGALLAMCLDIQIRESSNGRRGILDVMKQLSQEYGSDKPFEDDALFDKITAITYPEIRSFLDTYVAGPNSLPYDRYFEKVGVTQTKIQIPGNVFLKGQSPHITINPTSKEIIVIPGDELNPFLNDLGVKGGDVILGINGTDYNLDTIYDMITESMSWKENDPVEFKIQRDNTEMVLKGVVIIPYELIDSYQATNNVKNTLLEAWLRG